MPIDTAYHTMLTEDGYFYHATSSQNAERILAEGMREGSYWSAVPELADYYEETVEEDGDTPVVLKLAEHLITRFSPDVDHCSVAEPITEAIGKSEAQVEEEWAECEGTWEDSVKIVGSVRLMAPIPASEIIVDEVIEYS